MREGSLEAPTRHPIAWREESFYDPAEIEKELRRVFDICHGCRLCFNLCDSFPRLFDLVDESPTQELDGVDSKDFKSVTDACTLCDMCFMTKCPYVPPHEFNLDFPHLILRYRAMEARQGKLSFADRQMVETDRNGKLAGLVAPLANWATRRENRTVGPALRRQAGLHPDAELPRYASQSLEHLAAATPALNRAAPAFGRKAVLYATVSRTTTFRRSAWPPAPCWRATGSKALSCIRTAAACRCSSRDGSPKWRTTPARLPVP
jgi:glycerol-3-phosphate dehydrogenase subunit C